jgi:hypothetical protein
VFCFFGSLPLKIPAGIDMVKFPFLIQRNISKQNG